MAALFIPQLVFAATATKRQALFCSGGDFAVCISTIYNWSITIGGALAILMMIVAGYQYATSAGDVEQTNKAKEMIIGSITGLILLLLVIIILNVLSTKVNLTGDKYQVDLSVPSSSSGVNSGTSTSSDRTTSPDGTATPQEKINNLEIWDNVGTPTPPA